MDAWQVADAERNFARLVQTATAHGPQVVMCDADAAAVVMSMQDYRTLREQADQRFAAFLLASPMAAEDFDRGTGASLPDAT